jgi:hypothetical protein
MTTQESLNLADYYSPHVGQAQVHASDARIKVMKMGRRWGKDRCSFGEFLDCYTTGLQTPAPQHLVPPFHAWVVVPSFPQGRQIWNELIQFIPKQFIAPDGIHADEMFIYLRGTRERPWGMIEVKSAHDPEALQTVGLDFLWVTEAQDIDNAAFEKLLPTLRSPDRMRRAAINGIPALYPDHWFERLCRVAQEGRQRGYAYFHATAFDNPLLDEEDLAEIEADRDLLMEAAWRRMYLAEFDENARYYSNIDACASADLLPEPLPGARYVAGVDLGRKVDPTVVHIFDATQRKLVYHRSFDTQQSWAIQKEGIVYLCEIWGLERVVVDATTLGGDIFCEELREVSVPVEEFYFTTDSRRNLLSSIGVALERETVSYPAMPKLLRQLRSIQPIKQSNGSFRVQAPAGEHDDEVFALGLGLYACDPHVSAGRSRRSGSGRYVQTRDEMNGGLSPKTSARLANRRSAKMRQRIERSGFVS